MVKRVFFSFHFQNDIFRANQVRNSWMPEGTEKAGFIDKAEFEKVERDGDKAIKDWIDKQLKGTSVTVVLIGSQTLSRKYVQYEIIQSYKKGNKIIGVKIGGLNDINLNTSYSDISNHILEQDKYGNVILDTDEAIRKIYDYTDDGYNNLKFWIES